MKLSKMTLLGAVALLIGGAVILSSCEGPEGPRGADGVDGVDGVDGQDGQDANSTCILCHSDDQVIVAKSNQYAKSGHATGENAGYANRSNGPAYNCAGCHTSQGFIDQLAGVYASPYADATQPNCYTCHSIHDTYTTADWTLTAGDAVNILMPSTAVDAGSGNMCGQCHQMVGYYYEIDSLWADFDAGTETVTIDAGLKRAGVHHGPQYNILANMDLFEFTGDAAYPESNHILDQAVDGCVTCHMNDSYGDYTGHSMAMVYERHESETYNWPASCLSCHEDGGIGEDLDEKAPVLMAEIEGLLDDLYDLLLASGLMYPSDAPAGNAYLMQAGEFSTALTAAHWNYNSIREDRSLGFHNPKYIRAVLENTIDAITPADPS
jgi:hypothetical protein